MSNVQVIREFMRKFPENKALKVGDDVVFLYIGEDKLLVQDSGVVWQMWQDDTVTIVTHDGFRNVSRNHMRKVLVSES